MGTDRQQELHQQKPLQQGSQHPHAHRGTQLASDSIPSRASVEKAHPFHNCLLEDMKAHQASISRHNNEISSIMFAHDIQIHGDSQFRGSGEAMHNRTQLEDVATKKLSIPQMKTLEHDIKQFELRAAADHIPAEKVASFYLETANLLKEKPMHYSINQKNHLALELVHHAAYPESTTQGSSGTCNVSTVEYRMFSKDPQEVARMTAAVVKNGSFTTADGTKLHDNWHTIKPAAYNSGRDMLDKLVQTTLVNCHWERFKNSDDDDASSYFRFEQPRNQYGERVYEYKNNSTREEMRDQVKGGGPITDPQLTSAHLHDIYNQAARADDPAFAIANANPRRQEHRRPLETDADCTYVNSMHGLHQILTKGAREHTFPMEIQVHTANTPFRKQTLKNDPDAPLDDAHFNWHAISIKSYNTQTHTVKIHNSWGSDADVNIGLSELYQATMSPPGWKNSDE